MKCLFGEVKCCQSRFSGDSLFGKRWWEGGGGGGGIGFVGLAPH